MSSKIVVLGAGSFGTALAKLKAEGGHQVLLWARDPEVVRTINEENRHPRRLKQVRLPSGLRATASLEEAVSEAEFIVSAIPTVAVRPVWAKAKDFLLPQARILSATKGIECQTLMLVSDVLKDVLPQSHHSNLAYLSGPSFALELARRLPTAVTIAAENSGVRQEIQRLISTDYFRAYETEDVIGVEVGGALKNIIAIGAGAADGLGLGLNSRAALITRGLAEITRLATVLGGNPLTLAGLAGMGDLVLTCTGTLSRNRTVGFELGQGKKLDDILEELGEVAEGVNTTMAAHELSQKHGVDMPITTAIYRVLFQGAEARETVFELMGRALKHELK